jgi:hypothetical protein
MEPVAGIWPPIAPRAPKSSEISAGQKGDPHLRSAHEVMHYYIHATDGEMGRTEDFIVDDAFWVIRYMVVDTGERRPEKKVLVSPQWLEGIHYSRREVAVSLTRARILQCPEFHPEALVNREYEERLYDYYGRPGYWEDEAASRRIKTAQNK